MNLRPLPIGIDDFKQVIIENYYYVDKTLMIKELLDKKGAVTLFTRPRRFGKTLNMSMLQYFFENTGNRKIDLDNKKLFHNLKIGNAGAEYIEHMCKYPVISLSLKSAKQADFETAVYCIKEEIAREFKRHQTILDKIILPEDKRRYNDIMNQTGSSGDVATSLRFLSECLNHAFQEKVIILIDEYDVPLENAHYNNFYDKMVGFIRSLFESALKTNPHLQFAVITGCLRISRESIFTGLNNLNVMSILSSQYDEYFGFQPHEVETLLKDYHLEDCMDLVTKWYDGYRFGEAKVYNPWSVINYVMEATSGSLSYPRPYWSNTSSNSIVRDLVEQANASAKSELETLMAGGTIEKAVHEDITYDTVYDSPDNLWNFLFFTGYLKQVSVRMDGRNLMITMAIPNEEVASIYDNTIRNWFRDEIKVQDLSALYRSMLNGEADIFQKELAQYLQQSISYLDSREAFYHGFLLGILGNLSDYLVQSNRESGDGRLDIIVRNLDVSKTPVILELKVSDTFKGLETACDRALTQIEEKHYDAWLPDEGYSDVFHYGIAFFKKQCKIKSVYKQFNM